MSKKDDIKPIMTNEPATMEDNDIERVINAPGKQVAGTSTLAKKEKDTGTIVDQLNSTKANGKREGKTRNKTEDTEAAIIVKIPARDEQKKKKSKIEDDEKEEAIVGSFVIDAPKSKKGKDSEGVKRHDHVTIGFSNV